jgi:hypothetical protein
MARTTVSASPTIATAGNSNLRGRDRVRRSGFVTWLAKRRRRRRRRCRSFRSFLRRLDVQDERFGTEGKGPERHDADATITPFPS